MTYLLWKYAETQVGAPLLARLEEPALGNAPAVHLHGKLISQDLANSVLEYDSIVTGAGDLAKVKTVFELGAGYGRSAYVMLSLHDHIRYVIVDIPPALYVSQRYLSTLFPQKKIFRFRDFDHYDQAREEFEQSQLVFLMPNQLKLIPDRSVDLFVAIDCLHEMRLQQLEFYFRHIDRLARTFYFSCFKSTGVPFEEGLVLTENSYPTRPHWKQMYWRTRRVQSNFFEAFYQLHTS